mmetsp:Transcript_20350/g.25947  ORF Transcript_20350/g.25947 Transcript_20350/m.25947 type:complete len:96 (-) Transcript_20350:285-572(-)
MATSKIRLASVYERKKYDVNLASSPTTKYGTPRASTIANVGVDFRRDASLPVDTTPDLLLSLVISSASDGDEDEATSTAAAVFIRIRRRVLSSEL